MPDIKCSGFGGQGVLTAGLILANVAMDNGYEVSWIPAYGSEMRGGLATCNVRISKNRLGSPFIKNIDVLVAMNLNSVSLFEEAVVPGGVMIVNSSLIPEDFTYRSDIKVIQVAANEMAAKANNPRGLNILMLAATVATTEIFSKEHFVASVDQYFAKKGRSNAANITCIEYGWEAGLVGASA